MSSCPMRWPSGEICGTTAWTSRHTLAGSSLADSMLLQKRSNTGNGFYRSQSRATLSARVNTDKNIRRLIYISSTFNTGYAHAPECRTFDERQDPGVVDVDDPGSRAQAR